MQTIPVPVSYFNRTLMIQFEEEPPASLLHLDAERYAHTIKQVNYVITENGPRVGSLGYLGISAAFVAFLVWALVAGSASIVLWAGMAHGIISFAFIAYCIWVHKQKLMPAMMDLLATENVAWQAEGISFIYQPYNSSLCGGSPLQVVDNTSTLAQSQVSHAASYPVEFYSQQPVQTYAPQYPMATYPMATYPMASQYPVVSQYPVAQYPVAPQYATASPYVDSPYALQTVYTPVVHTNSNY
eukprot:TRINITY_DN17329_c0_g1_i1.p1 TRINITY_DN17329_c0_g1~~TRINITY_DN17329_c0_g1_i1.p1  ORF type:complete len:242 (+),score=39.38 TRINITY_DN17329_c0_g1_i1:15-740(+)